MFKTGVETRLEATWARLEDIIENFGANSPLPITRISISLFGYDYGATLARAFAHKLFDECDPGTTTYKKAHLEVAFVGLFDAVDRSMQASVVRDVLLPLTNSVDDGEGLPGPVKAALHLVAAHECRGARRSRLIGTGPLTPKWEERLVPGTSEDVGGGLKRGDGPGSRELHLASLHEMYRAAFRAGVPFPALDTLEEQDQFIARFFVLKDHINGVGAIDASQRYMRQTGHPHLSANAFLAHRRVYIQRLRILWEMYSQQCRAYDNEAQRLARPALGDQGVLTRMLGLGSETQAQAARRDTAFDQARTRKAQLRAELGWLEQVDREARRLSAGFATAPQQALLDEWFAPTPKPLSGDIEDLLELFLSDHLMISQMPTSPTAIKYFLVREFDQPDRTKTRGLAPDYVEQMRS
ncbi:hypothetical protein ACW9H6_26645 [Pseudomonas sp. SDO528_S397]